MTGARQPVPGEITYKTEAHRAGNAGCPAGPVVTAACYSFCRRAMGCGQRPAFPAPSSIARVLSGNSSGASRCESGEVMSVVSLHRSAAILSAAARGEPAADGRRYDMHRGNRRHDGCGDHAMSSRRRRVGFRDCSAETCRTRRLFDCRSRGDADSLRLWCRWRTPLGVRRRMTSFAASAQDDDAGRRRQARRCGSSGIRLGRTLD